MVPLRGLSGDARRAASMTLRQPASNTPNGLARISNPSITSTEWSTVYSAITAKGDNSASQAHADQRIIRRISLPSKAFIDWRLMRGHTLPGMGLESEPGDNFFFPVT